MTETSHTRSRRASLFGLLLQIVVFGGVLALSQLLHSAALAALAWYAAGGITLWFVCLLVYRQRELVDLEALDLEELRREKEAVGSEAIFDEDGGGGLGFRVAEARYNWMRRWLIPGFSLFNTIYLAAMGVLLWWAAGNYIGPNIAPTGGAARTEYVPLTMIALAVAMLMLFLYSRYASGMGRVKEWQHLRACGSYMIGNALAALAVIIALGIFLYTDTKEARIEVALARVIPAIMILLAAETLINFILDIYRPRTAGVEPRAAFDSRLLALLSEPGGIAHSIAEAMNYQFGFEVSQTWFYQLLQRTFLPLLLAGVCILWLLTAVVIVQPGEHVIIERWGRQLNPGGESAAKPYEAGFYWKWPWPIDVARTYQTSRLYEMVIGFEQYDAEADPGEATEVALWDQQSHMGQRHFDFVVSPPPDEDESGATEFEAPESVESTTDVRRRSEEALPVNLIRMDVAVQYKIRADKLATFSQQFVNPHDTLRDIAWEEVVRFNAATDVFSLLGDQYASIGTQLHRRIQDRLNKLNLGFEVIYVGVQNIHPEPNVSKEFRKVVTAEQEMFASIRDARVQENQVLSAVAGDRDVALAMSRAVENTTPNQTLLDHSQAVLEKIDANRLKPYQQRLDSARDAFTEVVRAQRALTLTREDRARIFEEFNLGMGKNVLDKATATRRVEDAQKVLSKAEAARDAIVTQVLAEARTALGDEVATALVNHYAAQAALEFWSSRQLALIPELKGAAATLLAQAQADRWTLELQAARELAQLGGEGAAFRAAPRVYKLRRLLNMFTDAVKDSRKVFLAFHPGDREVRVRFLGQEEARAGLESLPTERPNP